MKRITWWLFLVCLIGSQTACSDDDKTEEESWICPFKNAVLQQTTAKAGETLSITGEGFADGLNVYFRSELEKAQAETTTVSADGKQITFVLPDIAPGTYKIIIEQEGEWTVEGTLTVEKVNIEIKTKRKLLGYTFDNGITEEGRAVKLVFKLTWQGDSLMAIQQVNPENKDELTDYFNFDYSTPGQILVKANMEVVEPGSVSGYQDYFTIIVENNRVKNCLNPTAMNNWSYSEENYLKVAYNKKFSDNGYTYDAYGNLSAWDFGNQQMMPTQFEYTDKEQVNRMGIEFGAIYGLLNITNGINLPEFCAHLMRLTGKVSTLLPSGVWGKDKGEKTLFDFHYQLDEKGFVTEVTSEQYVSSIMDYATRTIIFTWEE